VKVDKCRERVSEGEGGEVKGEWGGTSGGEAALYACPGDTCRWHECKQKSARGAGHHICSTPRTRVILGINVIAAVWLAGLGWAGLGWGIA